MWDQHREHITTSFHIDAEGDTEEEVEKMPQAARPPTWRPTRWGGVQQPEAWIVFFC